MWITKWNLAKFIIIRFVQVLNVQQYVVRFKISQKSEVPWIKECVRQGSGPLNPNFSFIIFRVCLVRDVKHS